MTTEEDPESDSADSPAAAHEMLAGVAAIAVFLVGIYVVVRAIDPGHVHGKTNPGVFDLVVANRNILIAIRLAVLGVTIYVAYSSFELIRTGRPIDRFGPAAAKAERDIVDTADDAVDQLQQVQGELDTALKDNRELLEINRKLQAAVETRNDRA